MNTKTIQNTDILTGIEFFTGQERQLQKRYEVKPFKAKAKKVTLPFNPPTFKEFRGQYNGN